MLYVVEYEVISGVTGKLLIDYEAIDNANWSGAWKVGGEGDYIAANIKDTVGDSYIFLVSIDDESLNVQVNRRVCPVIGFYKVDCKETDWEKVFKVH